MEPRRLVPKDEPKDTFTTWLWIIAIGLMLTLVLAASFARAQDATFLACPPEFAECHAHGKAPASPSVDRVCLRKVGTTELVPALCDAVGPNEDFSIQFPKPNAGTDHQRYEAVACDDELGLCSAPADKIAIAVDLSAPGFFEVLRKAFGL